MGRAVSLGGHRLRGSQCSRPAGGWGCVSNQLVQLDFKRKNVFKYFSSDFLKVYIITF